MTSEIPVKRWFSWILRGAGTTVALLLGLGEVTGEAVILALRLCSARVC
jgi:hypothetical protein